MPHDDPERLGCGRSPETPGTIIRHAQYQCASTGGLSLDQYLYQLDELHGEEPRTF